MLKIYLTSAENKFYFDLNMNFIENGFYVDMHLNTTFCSFV